MTKIITSVFLTRLSSDVLLQQKKLGTPLLDCFNFKLEHELRKTNEFENISSALINIGGRIGYFNGYNSRGY